MKMFTWYSFSLNIQVQIFTYLWWDELMGRLGSTQENLCHLWKGKSLTKMFRKSCVISLLRSKDFYLLVCQAIFTSLMGLQEPLDEGIKIEEEELERIKIS